MKRTLLFFTVLPAVIWAQNYSTLAGGRSAGIAHSSVALQDIWAAHHNQAGLGFLKDPTAAISYEKRYFLPDINVGNAAFAYPTGQGTIGFSLTYFGFDLYHESRAGLNYARAFGKRFSAGLQLNYHQHYVSEGSGKPATVTFEAGFIGKPLPQLSLGFHVFNPTGSFRNAETGEQIPFVARLGGLYRFSDKVFLTAEIRKQQSVKERYSAGVEYRLLEQVFFRTGVSIQPVSNSLGLGFDMGDFATDFSYEYAQTLGSTANLSLQYTF